GNARYHEVAAGFGCYSQYVTKIEELGPAIKAAYASGRPACINVAIDVKPLPPELELLMGPH
ncbi:MAG: bznB, partial [Gammaproteobacteria bacterium]|nr:bznB [Gammaproteobacteria bacterium]